LASFEQKLETPAPELDMAKIKAEGFGPEAHDNEHIDPLTGLDERDNPVTGTRMII
jgi:hypothetical protein